jgi:hypothetical protein
LHALLTISAEGDIALWAGAEFETEVLKVPLSKLQVYFSEDPAQSNMFVLSCAASPSVTDVPFVYCFAKDGGKWLTILRRRGVEPHHFGEACI